MEQRSEAWFAARLGKVTASKISDIIGKTQSGYSASRANYMALLICERLTGAAAESYSNAAMQHGTDTEPMALSAYEAAQGVLVQAEGFVTHPSIEQSGASPDGLAGDGLVEIKCPNTSTHIATLLDQKVPEKYITQMMWQMACTERPWCDFVSFDPRLPEKYQLFIKRINFDIKIVDSLENSVIQFLGDVDLKIQQLESLP